MPYRSYVKGWKISPSHYLNQDLARCGSTNRAAEPAFSERHVSIEQAYWPRCCSARRRCRVGTAEEEPKHGGTLTYMIPADAPPSFDGHRESTYATVHSVAPFYSVLIRVNPENPSDTTDFVCDLCTAIPQPTDDGKTYAFKIRTGRQIP